MGFKAQITLEITADTLEGLNQDVENLRVYKKGLKFYSIYIYPLHEGINNDKEPTGAEKEKEGQSNLFNEEGLPK